MKHIDPMKDSFLLPDGTRNAKHAEHQDEYVTLPTLILPDGKVVSQWLPDENELTLLNAGVPITLVLLTFGDPLQPIMLGVGGMDLRQ